MDNKTAGFVGLGHMGRPMAANLLRGGWDVTLWNRSAGALEDLENLGGRRTPNVADMRDLPVIVCMLPDLPFIEEAAAGLLESWRAAPPRSGTAVVIMSSVSPSGVQDFGRDVQRASHGNAAVVDAPVSGGTAGAVDGTLAIMAGGAAADFNRLEPLFSAMGTTVRHMGALGPDPLPRPATSSSWEPRRRHSPKPRNSPNVRAWILRPCLRSWQAASLAAASWRSWDPGWSARTTGPPVRPSSCTKTSPLSLTRPARRARPCPWRPPASNFMPNSSARASVTRTWQWSGRQFHNSAMRTRAAPRKDRFQHERAF